MPNNDSLRETVLRSLIAVGSEREASFYAKIFQNLEPERFALILVDPKCLKSPLIESLMSDLKILYNLGLTPVLVVGALSKDKSSVRFQSERLSKALERAKIKMAKLNCASYQFFSEIRKHADNGRFVVLEMTEQGKGLDLQKLVERLNPAKIIFLQASGGFRINGQRLAVVNVDANQHLPAKEQLSKGQLKFLKTVETLVNFADSACTYVIVSPLNLLSELFTVKGAGTLLRRGAKIRHTQAYKGVDMTALKKSIETSFERKMCADYFERPFSQLFYEENYRGGAILTKLAGLPYLSKFWVAQEAQGEGIARDIWHVVRENTPVFFWRSRNDNPFNNWYMKMCEGMQVSGEWRVFWIGLVTPEIPSAILAAANSPQDFEQ